MPQAMIRELNVDADPGGLPDPEAGGARAPPRLPRQRRHHAEADGRARRPARLSTSARTRTSTAGSTRLAEEATDGVRGGPSARGAIHRRLRTPARSSSPATRPRRSTSSPAPGWNRGSSAGDEILLTEMEHHSNLVPWIMLAKRTGRRPAPHPGHGRRHARSRTRLREAAHGADAARSR